MTEFNDSDYPKLWESYADAGYSKGSGYKGFRPYVQATVPDAIVLRTIADGITLRFTNPTYATAFLLRWS